MRTNDDKKILTTGDVAKICRVAPRTVSKWYDAGRLKGYRLPGSLDRRIPRDEVIRFLKEHGIPLGELAREGLLHVLTIGLSEATYARLQELLPDDEGYRWAAAVNGFEAGLLLHEQQPEIILIDLAMGRSECLHIARQIRCEEQRVGKCGKMLLALANEDEADLEYLTAFGFNEAVQKPFDVALLAERIARGGREAAGNGHGKGA